MDEEVIAYYFIKDLGDGSACVRFFKDKEAAQKAQEQAEEEYGYTLSEGVSSLTKEDIKDA